MPTLPLGKCKHSLCMDRVSERGKGFCLKHQRELYKEESKYSSDPFYSSAAWRAARKHQRNIEPFCRECDRVGKVSAMTTCDHIIPREMGGPDFDSSNLQSLCDSCHAKKRQKERALYNGRPLA